MIHTDEDALLCDIAETYGVLDFHMLPINILATLCAGLRDDSRIIQKLTGSKLSIHDTLLALMTDRLGWLVWAKSEDGHKGRNRPASIYEELQGDTRKDKHKLEDVITFNSVEEFDAALKKIRGE